MILLYMLSASGAVYTSFIHFSYIIVYVTISDLISILVFRI